MVKAVVFKSPLGNLKGGYEYPTIPEAKTNYEKELRQSKGFKIVSGGAIGGVGASYQVPTGYKAYIYMVTYQFYLGSASVGGSPYHNQDNGIVIDFKNSSSMRYYLFRCFQYNFAGRSTDGEVINGTIDLNDSPILLEETDRIYSNTSGVEMGSTATFLIVEFKV